MASQDQERSDEELVRLVLAGEADAFDALVERHHGPVFRIVGRHVPESRIEEVAHEVFVQAFTSLATFSGRAPFAHWLAKVAVRRCYAFWREASAAREVPMSALKEEHQRWVDRVVGAEADESFRQAAERQEAREVVEWALVHLSPANCLVLTLVYWENLSVREVADLLGWSVVNVKVRAHRARASLRRILAPLADGRGRR
ncbi:RNA polymerase sigma factor [Nitrospira sp. Kam-Ns4a]